MNSIQISAKDLCKLLGIENGRGIFDVTMDAWDGPETTFTFTVKSDDELTASGLL